MMKRISLLLAAVLLLSLLTGCGDSGGPTEPSAAPTAPETTIPTTEAAIVPAQREFGPDNRNLINEQGFSADFYSNPSLYTALYPANRHVQWADWDFELRIPDDWSNRIEIFFVINPSSPDADVYDSKLCAVSVVSKKLLNICNNDLGLLSYDFAFTIQLVDTADYPGSCYEAWVNNGEAAIMDEYKDQYYILYTDQSLRTPELGKDTPYAVGDSDQLKELLTPEGYKAAKDGITCTLEEAKAMCKLDAHGPYSDIRRIKDYDLQMSRGGFQLPEFDREIRLPDWPCTITLPEEWVDKVNVYVDFEDDVYKYYFQESRGHSFFRVWVTPKSIIDLYDTVIENATTPETDYTLCLGCVDTGNPGKILDSIQAQIDAGNAAVIGQVGDYLYYVMTDQTLDLSQEYSRAPNTRKALMEALEEEGTEYLYDEARGDITCTLEEAIAMCSVDEN